MAAGKSPGARDSLLKIIKLLLGIVGGGGRKPDSLQTKSSPTPVYFEKRIIKEWTNLQQGLAPQATETSLRDLAPSQPGGGVQMVSCNSDPSASETSSKGSGRKTGRDIGFDIYEQSCQSLSFLQAPGNDKFLPLPSEHSQKRGGPSAPAVRPRYARIAIGDCAVCRAVKRVREKVRQPCALANLYLTTAISPTKNELSLSNPSRQK